MSIRNTVGHLVQFLDLLDVISIGPIAPSEEDAWVLIGVDTWGLIGGDTWGGYF